jgi:2-dehydropantoate 2-reductase
MKIGVVGSGAVGSYYGAKLWQSGQAVHFLLRSDFDVVRRDGMSIQSPVGSFHLRPACANNPKSIGTCDLVLIGLKTTANYEFPNLLPPLIGRETVILTLQNGLGNEEQLAKLVPPRQIMGGLAFVCLNRIAPGIIHHIDHGQIVIGEFEDAPIDRTHQVASMFRHAGVPCEVTPNLAQAHWEKLLWNIPFNGLGVAGTAGYEAVITGKLISEKRSPSLTTDILLGEAHWEKLLRELQNEVRCAAVALGYAIPEKLPEKLLTLTRTMGAYKASTLLDFENGKPLELESLFLEPLRQAQKAGLPTPRLQALCEVLKGLDAEKRSSSGQGPCDLRLA